MSAKIRVRQTNVFRLWFEDLRDLRAKDRIAARIQRLGRGSFGDCKSLGGGLAELRVDYGPGYRLYYTAKGREVVILLAGGDKRTQSRDIEVARRLAKECPDDD